MKRILFISFISFISLYSLSNAQTPNITSYTLETWAPGVNPSTGQPIQTTPFQANNFTCDQPVPTVPATVTNPTKVFIDDAAKPGRACISMLVANYLVALPNGTGYVTTITQTDNLGQTSARSAVSNPFGKQGSPAVVTGLKVF